MSIAFVFPGQGSQYVGMGKHLHEAYELVRNIYDEASGTLGYDAAALSFEGPEEELNRTRMTQPLLLTASYAAYAALKAAGVEPAIVAGHSLGEYTAVTVAGTLGFKEAVKLTEMRGRIMQEAVPEGKGLMAAILGLDRDAVDGICSALSEGYAASANYNCPGQIVISGEKAAVQEAMRLAKDAGARRVVPLSVSVPSHSALMEGAEKKLSEYLFLEGIEMKDPEIPVVGNADAIMLSTVDGIRGSLVKQLSCPVLWEDSVRVMLAHGVDTFVEVGPGRVLSGLIRRTEPAARRLNVQTPEDVDMVAEELSG